MASIQNILIFSTIVAMFSMVIWGKESPTPQPKPKYSYQNVYSPDQVGIEEQKADRIRSQGINHIQQLLKKNPSKETRFQLSLRLATLYVEKSNHLKTMEMNSSSPPAKNPKKKGLASVSYIYKAIKLFRSLAQEYPNHREADRVLFSLFYSLVIVKSDSAQNYLRRLIKRFPNSQHIPDAHLALGEHYFDKNDIDKAIEHYRKVMGYKQHRAYLFAVYKLAWCYYNKPGADNTESMANINKALAAFKLVIKHPTPMLRAQAMEDMLHVYADVNQHQQAWTYFKTTSSKDVHWTMMEKLALIYQKQGKHQFSQEIFHDLLKNFPLHPNNPKIVAGFIARFKEKKNYPKLMGLMKYLMTQFDQKSPWYKANVNKSETIAQYQDILQSHLSWCGTYFHKLRKPEQTPKLQNSYLNNSLICYQGHLTNFPKSDKFYSFTYYSAEIYDMLGEYQKAGDLFFHVTQKTTDLKLKETASINAISSYLALVNKKPAPKLGIKTNPQPIPALIQTLIKFSQFNINTFPKNKTNVLAYTTRIAQIYYDYSHFKPAFKLLNQIIVQFPKTKQASICARMILKVPASQKDWEKTNTLAQQYYNKQLLHDTQLQKDLLFIVKTSHYKWAEDLQSKKSFTQAGSKFSQYQQIFPNDEFAQNALYKAALNYQSALQMDLYVQTLANHDKLYPKSKLNHDILIRLATHYEDIMDFNSAAQYYFLFGQKHPKHADAPKSVLNAAVIYEGLEEHQHIYDCYDFFYHTFNEKMDPATLYAFAETALKLNKETRAAKLFKELSQTSEALDIKWLSDIQLSTISKSTKTRNARKHYRQALSNYQSYLEKTKTTLPLLANVLAKTEYNELLPLKKAFGELQLQDPITLGKDLDNVQERYVTIKEKLLKITHLGDPYYWVLSLYQLGLLNRQLSKKLFNATTPPDIQQNEALKFKAKLEKFAFPLEEEAEQLFKKAWSQVLALGVYSPETIKIYQELSQIDPVNYPPSSEAFDQQQYFYDELFFNQSIEGLI